MTAPAKVERGSMRALATAPSSPRRARSAAGEANRHSLATGARRMCHAPPSATTGGSAMSEVRNHMPPPTMFYRTSQVDGYTFGVDTSAKAAARLEDLTEFTPVYIGEYRLVRTFLCKRQNIIERTEVQRND